MSSKKKWTTKEGHLIWQEAPQNILIIKKPQQPDILLAMRELAHWLATTMGKTVWVEKCIQETELSEYRPWTPPLCSEDTDQDKKSTRDEVDLVISLGGDGTLLHVNSLFQDDAPPLVPISMGTLGFLTPFQFSDYQRDLAHLLQPHRSLNVTLRSRLLCTAHRRDIPTSSFSLKVLNELLVHSASSVIIALDLAVDDEYITTVQADGLIVSTPTGSTAYSTSAGGPMVAPDLPGIIVTPICPHTLSFRPLVLTASSRLTLSLNESSRSVGVVSFDARHPLHLQPGDYVQICSSENPLLTLSLSTPTSEWFHSIIHKLHWNSRQSNFVPTTARSGFSFSRSQHFSPPIRSRL